MTLQLHLTWLRDGWIKIQCWPWWRISYVLKGWPLSVSDSDMHPYFNEQTELSVEGGCLLRGVMMVIYTITEKAESIRIATWYHIVGKFGELTLLSLWWKKVWRINRSANRLLIVSTNLDSFSLANHRRFTTFAKLSPHQTFPLYGTYPGMEWMKRLARSCVWWSGLDTEIENKVKSCHACQNSRNKPVVTPLNPLE